VTLITKAN